MFIFVPKCRSYEGDDTMQFHKYVDITIPVEACNFRCKYCYIWQQRNMDINNSKFKYSAQHVASGLSQERLGGVCLMNICGAGETLFSQFTIDLAHELLNKGHFIIIVTNGCAQQNSYEQLAAFPADLKKRLLIKFSFHFLELKRLNLFDTYWKHVHMVRDAGIGISIEMCPSDETMPYKQEIKDMCIKEVGALPHITNARVNTTENLELMTELSLEEYKKFWSDFDSDMFNIKIQSYGVKRQEFCYAGDWSVYMDAGSGLMFQCHCGEIISEDMLADISRPINFHPVGKCKAPYCVNAHCGMCMGCLPDVNVMTFCATRDRVCTDGSHWLTDEWIKFSSQKLYENNKRLPFRKEINITKHKKHHSLCWHIRHLKF